MELYEDTADSHDLEALSQKLSADLLAHVSAVSLEAWLSKGWFEHAASLRYIASISQMEAKLQSSKSESNQTLFESDMMASRFIIEQGKLNLLLRLICEAKAGSIDDSDSSKTRAAGEACGVDGVAVSH